MHIVKSARIAASALTFIAFAQPSLSDDLRLVHYEASREDIVERAPASIDQLLELAIVLPGYYCSFTGKSWISGTQKMCEFRCTQGDRWAIWNLNVRPDENCYSYDG